ncbi:hypothetical protein HPB48_023243 [Haemaphysalis longicornis]|uniref:Uncharacterized protein n=1 Tax=Haemaphysalis longicornis TaxID=44386 RepID=A0A9J6H729_HAELO|nr:hypothetical protein HPB48_023243 [Haemaphysalis longicornis]
MGTSHLFLSSSRDPHPRGNVGDEVVFLEREYDEGDSFMADKGFRTDDVFEIGAKLNILPFFRSQQSTAE